MPIKWAEDEQPKSRIKWADSGNTPDIGIPASLPTNAAVLGGAEVGESREDQIRRKAQEDIVAGMSTFDKMSAGWSHDITRMGQAIKQGLMHAPGDNLLVRGAKAVLPDSGDANIDAALNLLGVDKLNQAAVEYDKQLSEQEAEYQLALGKDPWAWGAGLAGTMAATLPLGGPATKGGTILANMAKNAIPAALVSAATTPVEAGDDFLAAKARQAAVGGGVAAGVSGALQGAGKLIEEIPMGNLLRRGYNYLAGKANATPKAAEGEQLAQKLGVELTPGQVSGGKGQLAAENLARQSIFTRDQVFQNDMKIADQYATAIGKQLEKLAQTGGDTVTAGKAVRDSVEGVVNKLSTVRDNLARQDYALVDQLAGGSAKIVPDEFANTLRKISEENTKTLLGGNADTAQLAKSMDSMLRRITGQEVTKSAPQDALSSALGKRAAPTTVTKTDVIKPQTAADLLKTRRNLMQIAGGQATFGGATGQPIQKRAAAMLLDALDKDIEKASTSASSTKLGDALKTANDRYRGYSQKIDEIQKGVLGRMLGDGEGDLAKVAPEVIFDRFQKLPPSQLEIAKQYLTEDAEQQIKRAYVQKALESAQMETAAGGASQTNIRPLTFVKALQRDGNTVDRQKLKALFNDNELKELDELMDVGRRIGDRTGANASETAVMNQTMGILEKLRSGSLRAIAEVGGAALGTREIARIMADSGGRRALMELRKLPPSSARARELTAYLAGIAAVKETESQPEKR